MFKSLRLLLFIFMILGLIGWSYISFIRAYNSSLIVRSPLQGTIILEPKHWQLFPERIIPHYVKIETVPEKINIEGQVEYLLPYAALLKEITNLNITISYHTSVQLNTDDQKTLIDHNQEYLIGIWKHQIESTILNKIENQLKNNPLTDSNTLKKSILEELNTFKQLNIQFTHYPNMQEYQKLKEQVWSTINSEHLATQSAQNHLEIIQEQQKIQIKKQNIDHILDFAIEKSKSIKDANAEPQTVFSILGYILGSGIDNKISDNTKKNN